MKRLLVIAHAPSPNTAALRDALLRGATLPEIEGVEVTHLGPFEARPDDVRAADALVLLTTENLGYMSGALKDFFDRSYYPCLDATDALPYALLVRAGQDGTGTCRAVASITGGMRWKAVHEPVVCRGQWDDTFLDRATDLGTFMAAGLEAGIF
ncbi:MAG: flavodoxin family protein [Geminicoccaceae bacterium]|nr:flavodoxin family protein [Geminicoccaceae bacterium]